MAGPSRFEQDSLFTCSDVLELPLTGPLELIVKHLGIWWAQLLNSPWFEITQGWSTYTWTSGKARNQGCFPSREPASSMQLSGLEDKVHPQEAFRALSFAYVVAILRLSWWGQCNWKVPCMVDCLTWPHPGLPNYTKPPFIVVAAPIAIYLWLSFPGNKFWDGALCVETYWGVWKSFSCVWLFMTPWTVGRQAPLYVEFSRQEYRSG